MVNMDRTEIRRNSATIGVESMTNRWSLLAYLMTGVMLLTAVPGHGAETDDDEPEVRANVRAFPKRASLGDRSLPRLVQIAESSSPVIDKARQLLAIAQMERSNAEAIFYPALSFDATHGVQDASPRTKSSPWASQLNLTLKETLYDNGASITKYSLASRKLERAKLEYDYTRDEQLLKMTQAYLDWSSAQEQREIDENKRDLLRRQYNVMESQYKQGLKTKRDFLRIETEVRRHEIAILQRNSEVDLTFQRLATLAGIGREDLQSEEIEKEDPKPYVSLDSNPPELKSAQHRRTKILELKRQEAELDSRLLERERWPQVFLTGEVGYHNQDYVDTDRSWSDTGNWGWQGLLTLKYTIWDFGIQKRNLQIARVKVKNVENENRQILLDVGNELRDVYLRLKEFAENVKMSRELLVLEQQSYSILESEYRNGRASYLDLITNLNSLIDARSKFNTSYFGLRKQQMVYAFHKGDLYATIK